MPYKAHMRIVNDNNSCKTTRSVSQRMTKYDFPDIESARRLYFKYEPRTALRWILEVTDESGKTVLTLPQGTVMDLKEDPNGSGVWFLT